MKKFQVTIKFQVDDEFMTHLPAHRLVINDLIEKGIVDHYVVSMQSLSAWITFTADSREQIKNFLARSPLSRYWTYEIDELFVIDGYQYRLPAVQLN
jgi:muconolactone delta-isomerase